ncbi:EAL domain-containing protein [Vibrio sp. JC009]|uniref:bifunctional diguanylate cyclase/phosphodiesterase n=1 Tax=Vibrio sp. JC009 TaxID=2912314 RepID=UPI0023B1D2B2|nr:EAL domain-containing protein [Vibrio sp. JC009]WED24391.1 EAL domain-containing protein [Vibrio sp. JC009]
MNRIDTKNLSIPENIFFSWQKAMKLLAEISEVPAALIMRAHIKEIEVWCCNESNVSPFSPGDTVPLDANTYCAHVIKHQKELHVADCREDPMWRENPSAELGMFAYLGLPINWPDGSVFGTICIFDNKANQFNGTTRALIDTFRDQVESQLTTIFQQLRLRRLNEELKSRVKKRTQDLASLNYTLSQEIDRRRAAEQEINYQKSHDISTGFLNYDALKRKLTDKLEALADDTHLFLVQIGFTNGRRIQARYGDRALSELIVAYRERIGTIDSINAWTGRIGPVDLAIAIEAPASSQFIENFCYRLLELSHSEFKLGHEKIHLHAYIGVSSSSDSENAEDMTLHSREAMLSCKESGQKYMFYSSQLSATQNHVNKLESYLLQAVRNDDLILYFQPKVDLQNGGWKGAEALIRWNHPELGVVSNETLIQMAEQNGLIFEVGNFVLRSAIEQASEWYLSIKDFKVAVNVSAVQLQNKEFVEQLEHLLETYKLPASYIELEITESALISNELLAQQTLQELKSLGVTLSLDDFGTGYASFSYLKKYPFTNIKIDKSFIQNIANKEEDKEIMHSIIQVAKKMDLLVTVEGIETVDQELFVVNEGCDFAQGYLYGKPMDTQEFSDFFIQQSSHHIVC